MNDYTPYNLDPEFYDRLKAMQNRVSDVRIASGYRSDFQQQQLRDAAQAKDMNPDDWFAPAGESSHNYGLGADLTGNLADVHRYAPLYGLYHALNNDPWHIEPAYVTELGLPYKAKQAPVHFDYKNVTPTGDNGLDQNLQNQADARAAQQMKTVPAGIPLGMVAPDLRMNMPEARRAFGASLMENAGHPITQPLGEKQQASPDQGISPDQPKTQPAGVGQTPDLSAQIASGQGAVDQRNAINENKLRETFNANAAWTAAVNSNQINAWNQAVARNQAGGGGGGSASGSAIVNAAMSHLGKPYSTSGRFGPNAYDCSGLVVAALREAGIDPGGNTVSTSLQMWGTPIDLQTAYRTPGAMLFVWGSGAAGHVEISRGDGTTIGSSRGGVLVRSAMNRGWTGAALPPGMGAGNAPAMGAGNVPAQPVSQVPDRLPTKQLIAHPTFTIARMQDIMARGGPPGGVLPTATAPMTAPQSMEETVGTGPPPTDKAAQPAAPQQNLTTSLPPGAPPPASQPGNPNPVSTPSPVAQGETLSAAQKAQPGQPEQVSLPADVPASSGQGEAMGLAAYSEGKTAVPGPVTPVQAQPPGTQQGSQQGGQQGGQAPANNDFFGRLLSAIGAPDNAETRGFLEAWQRAEGGSPDNPFNTTQSAPGATNFNSVGVKRYPSIDVGLMATLQTLNNGRYGNILDAIRHSDKKGAARALAASPWGTGSLVMKIVGA